MYDVSLSAQACRDLCEIETYISEELGNPAAAERTVDSIIERIRSLENFPQTGSPLQTIIEAASSYRFLVCGNYLAFYYYSGSSVFVSRILYGKRECIKILFETD